MSLVCLESSTDIPVCVLVAKSKWWSYGKGKDVGRLPAIRFNLVGSNSPTLGSALIFFCYKESPARREAREGVRNTPLLAAGIGCPSGDSLFLEKIS